MGQHYAALVERLAEVVDLNHANAVLGWDQETYMPPAGVNARSEQLATLSKLSHDLFVAPTTGRLLRLAASEPDVRASAAKSAVVCVAQRDYAKDKKLPLAFVTEWAKSRSLATHAWRRARKDNSFKAFAPWLTKSFDFARRAADYLGWDEHPYDALLDIYEPGMKTSQVRAIFADLRDRTVPLVKAVVAAHAARADLADDACIRASSRGRFPKLAQEQFAESVVRRIGYSFERGRMDYTAHPFCTNFSRDDVRITTRVDEDFFNTLLFSVLHEAGHALYEQGVDAKWERTPVCRGASLGMHESQSRLWENVVGRSREFWAFFYPRLGEYLPAFRDVPVETFYRAVNKSEPSLIRIEADELTYNLHIMARFELELALLEGALKVKDVPDAWNAKYEAYLGLTPPNDADGCLQDVHWSMGLIGYFPTYTLGNLISAQLFEAAQRAIPNLKKQIAKGDFAALLAWLVKNVHRHGRSLPPNELLKKATGQALTDKPYVAYLRRKFSDIYALPPATISDR